MILRKEFGGSNWIMVDEEGEIKKKFEILDIAISWAFDNNMACCQIGRQAFIIKQVKPKKNRFFKRKINLGIG
jgi:hypothetical protein